MISNIGKSFSIPPEFSGKRADVAFANILNNLSRSQIRKFIRDSHILLDGKTFKPSKILCGGEILSINIPPPEPIAARPENIDIEFLFEDEDIVIVNKPYGMVVHSGAGVKSGTLVNALLFKCDGLSGIGGKIRPGIVHRLDKNTSGVMVVAKNDFSHSKLVEQFKKRLVKKEYLAIVHGVIKKDFGTYSSVIGRHKTNRIKMASNTNSGRESITNWEVVRRFNNATLVKAFPETGRTHQIRVHFAESGFPLVGDSLYGFQKREKEFVKNLGKLLDRHALHSHKIGLYHPRTEKFIEYSASLPDDLKKTLSLLENQII